MAPLRLVCVVVLAALCLLACAANAPALATASHASTRRSSARGSDSRRGNAHAHPATRCSKAKRASSRRGRGVRSTRRGHTTCTARKHVTTKHRTKRTGRSRSNTSKPPRLHTRSKSADDGCANATLQPSDYNLEAIRAATLCLVNRERAAHGESALQANAKLQQAAQSHTESMVQDDYFEHLGPQDETLTQRARAAGYIYSSQIGYELGENIAWGGLWEGTPQAIVAGWMASPGHRENILDPKFRDTGIGVSPHPPAAVGSGQTGGLYTQDFGVIVTG